MVIIRLSRHGAKRAPFYHVVAADHRMPRDGRYLEKLGFFNPVARGQEERLRIDIEAIETWTAKGAQLSDRVKKLVKEAKLGPVAKTPKPKKTKKEETQDKKVAEDVEETVVEETKEEIKEKEVVTEEVKEEATKDAA